MAELPTGWVMGKALTFKGQPARSAWLPGARRGDAPRSVQMPGVASRFDLSSGGVDPSLLVLHIRVLVLAGEPADQPASAHARSSRVQQTDHS